jgi:hypothetical protein
VRQHPRIPCVHCCASQQRTVHCGGLLPVCSPRLVRRHLGQTVQARWPAAVGTYLSGFQALGHHVWSASIQGSAMCVRGPVEPVYKGLYQDCEAGIYRLVFLVVPLAGVLALPGLYNTGDTAVERCSQRPRARYPLFMFRLCEVCTARQHPGSPSHMQPMYYAQVVSMRSMASHACSFGCHTTHSAICQLDYASPGHMQVAQPHLAICTAFGFPRIKKPDDVSCLSCLTALPQGICMRSAANPAGGQSGT